MQEEGLSLAKHNSELEATARRLKAAARGSEAEHQRVLSRVQQLEIEVAREHGRYSQASQAAGEQVLPLQCTGSFVSICLALISAVTAFWETMVIAVTRSCTYCSGSGHCLALLLKHLSLCA